MTRQDQLYGQRLYEGEHVFACGLCQSTFVQYSFGTEPNEFFDRQAPPTCTACGTYMEWAGWSGQSDITEGLVKLIQDQHYMAASVMLAAFVKYQINALLWAALVCSGLQKEQASDIANGTLPRAKPFGRFALFWAARSLTSCFRCETRSLTEGLSAFQQRRLFPCLVRISRVSTLGSEVSAPAKRRLASTIPNWTDGFCPCSIGCNGCNVNGTSTAWRPHVRDTVPNMACSRRHCGHPRAAADA
jgi:hypothetical protein